MKISAVLLLALIFSPLPAQASPWAQKEGYFPKTGGKLVYGLNNSLLGWTNMFMEAHQEDKYETQAEGFFVGMARSIIYTSAGLVQLVTFPIPVDFPDVGQGLHVLKPAPKAGKTGKAAKAQDKSAWTKAEPEAAPAETAPAEVETPEPAAAAPKPALTSELAAIPAAEPAAGPVVSGLEKAKLPAAPKAKVKASAPAPKKAAAPTSTTASPSSARTLDEALEEIEQAFGK